jgi:hypothetical protein
VDFAIESRFSTHFVLDVMTENQSAFWQSATSFADVRGFSFLEGTRGCNSTLAELG